MRTKATTTLHESAPADYIKLPLAVFRNCAVPEVDIYCLVGDQDEPSLFASREWGITEEQLLGLEEKGHSSLYISKADSERVSSSLLDSLEEIVADDSFPAEERFQVLQCAIAQEVDRTLRLTNCSRFVGVANRIGTQIAGLVSENAVPPQQLFALAEHDTTTFVHSTNVAAYSVMLARSLGVGDPIQLRQIAVGAMVHDFGKRFIPKNVLTKPSKLTASERELIETHPQRGYEELCEQGDLTFAQLMMVYQHHEWINGGGYPVGVVGKEIHPWAKIMAVVDVFDAITSRRPYCRGMSVAEALHHLEDGSNKHFEPEAVRCWISLFRQRSRK